MGGLLKFITCGSVDDGKSTLIGHILYDSKLLYADQEKALLLESRVGSRGGDIDYSLLLDGLMAEREQGITIDVAYRYFNTDRRSFIVADTPGHEEYTRNMAVGASFAQLAVVMVDATQGVLIQTKRHTRICSIMGIRYFVFAVNKMDLVQYGRERFEEIEKQIHELEKQLNLYSVKIIPVSATEGDNVTSVSDKMPWYTGGSLLNYLEEVDVSETGHQAGFYMPVQRVSRPDHEFRGFQGQIENGNIRKGQKITVFPGGEQAKVERILAAGADVEEAYFGQAVSVTLDREVDISRGCVLSDEEIPVSGNITATLLWMDDEKLTVGREYLIKLGSSKIAGVVKQILHKIDVNTGELQKADQLSKNEIALCVLEFAQKIAVDTFQKKRTLGELILIDRVSHMTSACGVVERVHEEKKNPCFEQGGISVGGYLFDELYFHLEQAYFEREKVQGYTTPFGVGDAVPVKGETYEYPEDFDIVSVDAGAFVKIRKAKVESVERLGGQTYEGIPMVDERGFALNVKNRDEWNLFYEKYGKLSAQNRADFQNEYFSFGTYRKIVCKK